MTKKVGYYQVSMPEDEVSRRTESHLLGHGFEVAGTGAGSTEFSTTDRVKFKAGCRWLAAHKVSFGADIVYADGNFKQLNSMKAIGRI
jgi:hypothetical protein